jgi:transmembrane sensor
MTAGEELQAGVSAMTVKTADVAAETSWKSGVVVFKAETLARAAAEVNRYTDRPVRLADASLADYRITGVFKTGDPDHFAQAVTEILPVRVEPQTDGSLLLSEK